MNQITVSIDEFPQDGAPWRIDGLGKLHSTGSSRSEPLIDVHLSKLKHDYGDPLSNGSLSVDGQWMRIPIKVGLIALLKPGSVWINKVRRMPKGSSTLKTTIKPGQVKLYKWGSEFEFEEQRIPLIASRQFRVPTESLADLEGSWVALIRNPTPNTPYLIIPSSIIFQKCFSESPEGVRRLLQGELHRIIDTPQRVVTSDERETYFVEVYKEIRTDHVYAYANLFLDPIGSYEYKQLRRSLVTDSINETLSDPQGSHPYIKLGLPFSQPINVLLHGKSIPIELNSSAGQTRFGFMATEIIDLNVRLVFDSLIVHRKNSGDKGVNSEDSELKPAWPRPPASKIDLRGHDLVPAVSDEEPISNLEKLIVEESGGFNAIGLEVIKDPKLTQAYRRKFNTTQSKDLFNGKVTTGDSKSGDQGAAALDIQTDEVPRTPVTLETFLETLRILREAGHPFQTIGVAKAIRYYRNIDVVNFFPRHIKNSRGWHLASGGPFPQPRGYIVATLLSGGTWHHLIEIQRKEEKARSLAYIRTDDGALIGEQQMRLFMLDVAHERGWNASSSRPRWTLTSIKHSPNGDIRHFARAIAKAIGLAIENI